MNPKDTDTRPGLSSLLRSRHSLSEPQKQREILEYPYDTIPCFEDSLHKAGHSELTSTDIEILQVNVGKVCNQACRHCHVDAAPDRVESMSEEIFLECLRVLDKSSIHTVDITGGAPEMNPHFRWFIEAVRERRKKVIVRCNLSILVSNRHYQTLPEFFAANQVEICASLPFYTARRTDAQRGEGVFVKSIQALQLLNAAGYGKKESGLVLNLVYNPTGAFLPASQTELESVYRESLLRDYGIEFNHLYCITNMPVNRFLEQLESGGTTREYLEKLASAFNPATLDALMCKNMLSVAWDGSLHDCDFNQMLEIGLSQGCPEHIRDFNPATFSSRRILTGRHCYGCTAGEGSSCGGSLS